AQRWHTAFRPALRLGCSFASRARRPGTRSGSTSFVRDSRGSPSLVGSRWLFRPRAEALRIVVDVTPLSLPRTGIGNYLRGMVGGLAAVGQEHEIVAFAPTGLRGRRRVRDALAPIAVERKLVTLPAAHPFRLAWSTWGRVPVE